MIDSSSRRNLDTLPDLSLQTRKTTASDELPAGGPGEGRASGPVVDAQQTLESKPSDCIETVQLAPGTPASNWGQSGGLEQTLVFDSATAPELFSQTVTAETPSQERHASQPLDSRSSAPLQSEFTTRVTEVPDLRATAVVDPAYPQSRSQDLPAPPNLPGTPPAFTGSEPLVAAAVQAPGETGSAPIQPPASRPEHSVGIAVPGPEGYSATGSRLAPMAPPPPKTNKTLVIVSVGAGVIVIGVAVAVFVWYFWLSGSRHERRATSISGRGNPAKNAPSASPIPSPSASSSPDLGAAQVSVPEGMVAVPAGAYTIGRDDGDAYARPGHSMTLGAFYIDRTEVTNAEYKKFLDSTGHNPPDGWHETEYTAGQGNWPVTQVTWQDAADYASWSGKRLPTEAEWEAAARGSDGRVYPWGNQWQAGLANIGTSGITGVGQFKEGASPCGALDMIGNVWEWTADEFSLYPGSAAKPPDGLNAGAVYRVIRGGAFDGGRKNDATYRGYLVANKPYPKTGFRCVKSAGG